MGKFITEIFANKIISMIEAKMNISFYMPEQFKTTWFEGADFKQEYKAENCIMDEDGFWRSKKMDSGNGRGQNTQYKKFWWRIEPNYSCAGRPCYSQEKIEEIYRNSETKKYILKFVKSQVCLEWDGFDPPTGTCWGLRMKTPYITIYENGKQIYKGLPIFCKGYKKHLRDFIMEYYKYVLLSK